MTELVKEYFRRYPEPEIPDYEDAPPDEERRKMFMSMSRTEKRDVLIGEGVPKNLIVDIFGY